MRTFVLICVVLVGACGEKRNPDRCCVDETDCANIGLPNGSTCQPGELCRGNECVEVTCSMSSECDLSAPYCEDQHCAEMCTSDASCPGAGQPALPFCVGGGCVACRDGMDDCAGGLVCASNTCVNCVMDEQCSTGLCLSDGHCANADQVAFVSPTGSPSSNCTKADPCSLSRAITISPEREQIQFTPGLYQNSDTLVVHGVRRFLGLGPDQTQVTNTGTGPVFSIPSGSSSNVTISGLKIFGATNGATSGFGIECSGATLNLAEVEVTGNASTGAAVGCAGAIERSVFTSNGGAGLSVSTFDMAVIDRVLLASNTGSGISLFGNVILKNSFIFRNGMSGVELRVLDNTMVATEFNTIADNTGAGVLCMTTAMKTGTVSNSILANNSGGDVVDLGSGNLPCNLTGTLTTQQVVGLGSSFQFKSPSTPPYDYHLNVGSYAIDRAGGGAGTVDFDGDARPKGAAADVGADEAF